MAYSLIIICALALITLTILYRVKASANAPQSRPTALNMPQKAEKTTAFRGKLLIPEADCCMAAHALSKITFSLQDQVRLPLAACDKTTCLCDIKLIHNRRTGERRVREDRRTEIRFAPGHPDRRQQQGRRKEDIIWSGGYAG
ncbi:hypothetical protein [Amphritea pacifica]|uniref:hypothetical protein n=1 Tax=Amphritea pacifica TaxID=2811233 RepID=UPI001965A530|nr:hypothetical protein [Amphritea pacifica]MBN1006510.1 hypothetical protein [Amphritea pacifica]